MGGNCSRETVDAGPYTPRLQGSFAGSARIAPNPPPLVTPTLSVVDSDKCETLPRVGLSILWEECPPCALPFSEVLGMPVLLLALWAHQPLQEHRGPKLLCFKRFRFWWCRNLRRRPRAQRSGVNLWPRFMIFCMITSLQGLPGLPCF